jgi:3,2-trans-enoyl-CoA isomerase
MLKITDHGRVREIQLNRTPANALNRDLVGQVTDQLLAAPAHCSAVVVSGLPGMFSGGLDVPTLLQLDRAGMADFWRAFAVLSRTIAFMPIPTVFALNGHCPAGGIVLSLYGDYRIMSAGKFKTGLNEVQVGLVISPVIRDAVVRLMGPHAAAKILVPGKILNAEEALSIGLVDALAADPEATVREAIAYCQMLVALPSSAMLATRALVREDLHALFKGDKGLEVDDFLNIWFADQTQQTLKGLVARLQNK